MMKAFFIFLLLLGLIAPSISLSSCGSTSSPTGKLPSPNRIELVTQGYFESSQGAEVNVQLSKRETILCEESWVKNKSDGFMQLPRSGTGRVEIDGKSLGVSWKYDLRLEGSFPQGLKPSIVAANLRLCGPYEDAGIGPYNLCSYRVTLSVPSGYEVLGQRHDTPAYLGAAEAKNTWIVALGFEGAEKQVQLRRVDKPSEIITLHYRLTVEAEASLSEIE